MNIHLISDIRKGKVSKIAGMTLVRMFASEPATRRIHAACFLLVLR